MKGEPWLIVATASINLRATTNGGLRHPWPVPTPSFLLLFGEIRFGAEILTSDGKDLHPGDAGRIVNLYFWAPEAREFTKQGSSFLLAYGDRNIGDGEIKEMIEDRPLVPHPPGWKMPYGDSRTP